MQRTYTTSNRLIVKILLSSLLIQSCYNPPTPTTCKNIVLPKAIAIDFPKHQILAGREFLTRQGHKVTFYQSETTWRAKVVDKDKIAYDVPLIQIEIDDKYLSKLDKENEEKYIGSKIDIDLNQGWVRIGEKGMLGGMKSNKGKEKDDKEKKGGSVIRGEKGEVDEIKQENISLAMNLLEDGDTIENIMEATDLSREEVEELDKAIKVRERMFAKAKVLLRQGKNVDNIVRLTKLSRDDIEHIQATSTSNDMDVATSMSTSTTTTIPRQIIGLKETEHQRPTSMKRTRQDTLPAISYDLEGLLSVLSKLPMSLEKRKEAKLYLEYIENNIEKIREYQADINPAYFYSAIKAKLLLIRNTTNCLYEFTRPYDSSLANTLKKESLKSIAPLEEAMDKILAMTSEERAALESKTKRLYAEQSYIFTNENLKSLLKEHLTKIRQLLSEKGKPVPVCYISYAWPSDKNKKEEYWIQPFLSTLYDHLKAAGIRVIMDVRDNKPGNSIYNFMGQYHDGNHVILVGTESLLEKHYSPILHAVKTELSIISQRPIQDQNVYGYSRIYPLLISGSMKTSFPEVYDKYSTVRDPREGGYIAMLQGLLDWAYNEQVNKMEGSMDSLEEAYKSLWHSFNASPSAERLEDSAVNQELQRGYHRRELRNLEGNDNFSSLKAQQATHHSSAVNAEIIGVLIKSQGTDPCNFYSTHGEQFQRPSITTNFIERPILWGKVMSHLEPSKQQIVTLAAHGLGGVGKTELAKYYYLHPPTPYTLRAWFHAEDRGGLYTQYIDLAKANGIEYPKEMPIEEQAMLVKRWLESQKDCLLIYDNVPGARGLEGLLPEQGKHHILITTRNDVEWPAHQKVDIDVMEKGEAIDLIVKITGYQKEDPKLLELVNTLERLPLALAQAAAYMVEKKTNIADYLSLYLKYQPKLLSDSTLALHPKHEPVWITFNINLEALEKDCPAALSTLHKASFLASSDIPEALLKSSLEDKEEAPTDPIWPDIKSYIGKYSLMRIDSESRKLSMHRLIQDILRSKCSEAESKEILKEISLTIISIQPENDKTVESIALVRSLLLHIEAIASHLKKFFNEQECTDFDLTFYLGNAYDTLGDYDKAKECFYNNLLIKQKLYPDDHLDIAILLNNLGMACDCLGEHAEALSYYEQSLEIQKAIYPENQSDIASVLNNIGNVYGKLGKYLEALECYKQSSKIRNNLYPKGHPDTVASLHNIGNVYANLDNHPKALKYLGRALKILQNLYKEDHADIANSLSSIGNVYGRLKERSNALKYLKQALKMYQNLYLGNHPAIASSLYNIGNTYKILEEYPKSLEYSNEALEMRKAIYPEKHPSIAMSLNNIGSIYHGLGNNPQALHYLKEALEMRRAIYLDNNHPDVATSLYNIGMFYHSLKLKDHKEALEYLRQALEMRRKIYGEDHLDIATTLNNIGSVYYNLNKHQEALESYKQSLQIEKKMYSENHLSLENHHSRIASSYKNIGLAYLGLKKYLKSLKYFEQAAEIYDILCNNKEAVRSEHCSQLTTLLDIIEGGYILLRKYTKSLTYHNQDVANSLHNMGTIYFRLGNHSKALKCYQECMEIYKIIYSPNHPFIQIIKNNIEILKDNN
jgi:tetratricopeptide (TPR) repeat protein